MGDDRERAVADLLRVPQGDADDVEITDYHKG